ncbi:MAG: hypothetical protein ACOYXC_06680 [Candidatus Rifleibacteriota bacterium]
MIKLIKKQQGLPFLLSLGVLFLLSASFLAVQIWSDGGEMRGAAAALESPVLPPDLTAPTVVPPPRPVAQPKAKKVATPVVEEAAPEEQMPIEEDDGDKVEAPVSDEKNNQEPAMVETEPAKLEKPQSVKSVSQTKAVVKEAKTEEPVIEAKVTEPEKKPAKVEKPAENKAKASSAKPIEVVEAKTERVEPVQAVEVKVIAPPATDARPVKKARKPRVQAVETEIPPEWNWFNTPLKLDVNDGKLEIVADPEKKVVIQPSAVVKPAEYKEENIAVSEDKPVLRQQPVAEKPFSRALAKMNQLKERRQGVKKPVINRIPAVVARSEAALKRIQDMVKNICSDEALENTIAEEKADETSMETSVEASVEASEDQSELAGSASINEGQESSYAGSGSSFSMKVNDLIRSGAWLKD